MWAYVIVVLFFLLVGAVSGIRNMGRNLRLALICGIIALIAGGPGILIGLLTYLVLGLAAPEKPKTYLDGLKERTESLMFWDQK